AALGFGKQPGVHSPGDAGLQLRVAGGRGSYLGRGDGPRRADHELDGHLAGELRKPGELAFIAIANLIPVGVDDAPDQLFVQRAPHSRLGAADPDVRALLRAEAAGPHAVIARPSAAALGPDAADPDGVAGAAAPGARASQAQAAETAGVAG